MERVNLKFFQRFWNIAQAYWFSEQKWRARGLLAAISVLLLAYTGLSVVLNNQRGALISSLSAQDEGRFWNTIVVFVGVLVVYAPLLAGYTYLQSRLGIEWRRWLTENLIDRYFGGRAFYRLGQLHPDVDNPDQRLAEDVRSFTLESLTLLLVAVSSVLQVIAFSGVLWGISRPLVGFLALYALLGTLATVVVFGKPLVQLNFAQLKKEADFRFGLVRIRENAEAIAFYQGEAAESSQVKQRFVAAFENFKRLILWELGLNALTNAYEFVPFILPALVVAPAVFAGDLEVGKVTEAQGAFIRVFFSLNVVVDRFQSLTAFGAGIDRLYGFTEALESEAVAAAVAETTITTETAPQLSLVDLTLQTPGGQRTLVEDLSVTVPPAQSLLVMGPSGCGKSSLLRAIAGLWSAGSGTVQRPDLEHMLFLPQKPYMILGTLRQQLLYPHAEAVDDARLHQVLVAVNLADLDQRFGGFEAEADWGEVLSLGEQQRLTFARLLLQTPKYAILDEATSALDLANEAQLYQQLQASGTTYVSVGHRQSLLEHHAQVLELGDGWQLRAADPAT